MSAVKRWLVATVRSNAEWHVHTKARRHGLESFIPYYIENARHGHWQVGRVRPHIPGYVFVVAGKSVQRQVLSIDGVSDLLRDGEHAAMIPDTIVEALKRDLMPFYDRPYDAPKPGAVEVGGEVRLVSGPFVGFVGIVASIVGPDSVQLWLEMMRRKVPITVKAVDVEALQVRRALSA